MSVDPFESEEFSLHIRRLLYNYSLTHLTTNYLTYTENLVSEFIEYLQPIPLTDPYSLVLSVDPFQIFSQLHSLSSLKPYDEIPQTTKEALAYLKIVMKAPSGNPLTDRIVLKDDSPIEPFLPALTRRARKSTLKLGKGPKKPYSAREHADLLKSKKIDAVPVEPIQEEILSPEDILWVKYQIQPDELQAVKSLLQTTTDMLRPQKTYKNKYLDPDYLRIIPLQEPIVQDDPFMPIFPRARRARSGIDNQGDHLPELKGYEDIPKVVLNKIEVEDPDGDISRQNLVVVSGWETIRSSPPSSPSSHTSDDIDQLDELFLASSPDTEPPLVDEILKSKLEPILMPRTRKIGGKSGISPHILAGKTLSTFLQPLLKASEAQVKPPRTPEKTRVVAHCPPLSPTSSSLLGQPPSDVNTTLAANVEAKVDRQDQDLDSELKNLYVGHGLEDMIMKEALDDKQQLMMDVPSLPAPNVHPPNDMLKAHSLSDLLIPPSTTKSKDSLLAKKAPQPLQRFLKKVKGRESLSLALSWIPFTVDKKLPSAAELLGVTELFSEVELGTEVNQTKLEALLKSLDLSDEDDIDTKRWNEFDRPTVSPPTQAADFQILRTRKERRRLARLENRLEDGMEDENEEPLEYDKNKDKREVSADDGHVDSDGQDMERPAKRARLDVAVDDPMRSQGGFPSAAAVNAADEQDWQQQPASPQLSASDDKENWPPLNEESFEPLSFGSRQFVLGNTMGDEGYDYGSLEKFVQLDTAPDDCEREYADPRSHAIAVDEPRVVVANDIPSSLDLGVEPEIASRSLGIAAFAQLRARKINESKLPLISEPTATLPPTATVAQENEKQKTPEEIFDRQTLRLPDDITIATSIHRYMASVDLIQKHALVCALRSDECAVGLVERQSLDGVDLILDPHCAIIFLSVFILPARCESFVARVSHQSWNFSRILVVFEAYPEHRATRRLKEPQRSSAMSSLALDPYAYTTPIVKAIKKFRRDVNIAEGCGSKCAGTRVEYAFANTVAEAALFARMYGDMAEAKDETQGALWGEREWLALDFSEVGGCCF
ncbi:hypothetical protein BDN70DRAFT_807870 [Pholiota conissans]|uniref:Uncharacterized protein n=1 Tax=Pholiota conissans TaxID=109636 RepID=A0A9P5Z0H4_9AGAR|nr:hypothetical protein BDN70DRAFT_807870 [Pholiota conissans]